jgi:ketosteroid isomerase-like protein
METVMETDVSKSERELLESAYRHFNLRDIDGVLGLMHADVDWPNGMEGGREIGHDAVRAYWTRQWQVVDPHVEPIGFSRDAEGRIAVDVHQVVRDIAGKELLNQNVDHIYSIEGGKIRRMEIGTVRGPQIGS